MRQLLQAVLKSLGILLLMAISGTVCLIVSVFILMHLGLGLHGQYDYYWQYSALFLPPALAGFLAPLLLLRWLKKMGKQRRRAFFRTVLIAVLAVFVIAVLLWTCGHLGMF